MREIKLFELNGEFHIVCDTSHGFIDASGDTIAEAIQSFDEIYACWEKEE